MGSNADGIAHFKDIEVYSLVSQFTVYPRKSDVKTPQDISEKGNPVPVDMSKSNRNC